MRDSFAASESVELAPNGVADFHRNGWPACLGMGGRIASEWRPHSIGTGGRLALEWVAGLRRNGRPTSVGTGGRLASESVAGLARITDAKSGGTAPQ